MDTSAAASGDEPPMNLFGFTKPMVLLFGKANPDQAETPATWDMPPHDNVAPIPAAPPSATARKPGQVHVAEFEEALRTNQEPDAGTARMTTQARRTPSQCIAELEAALAKANGHVATQQERGSAASSSSVTPSSSGMGTAGVQAPDSVPFRF